MEHEDHCLQPARLSSGNTVTDTRIALVTIPHSELTTLTH